MVGLGSLRYQYELHRWAGMSDRHAICYTGHQAIEVHCKIYGDGR
jgi:hypothetical protein